MKSNAKSKIIILITLGILFVLSPIIITNLSFIMGNSDRSSENSDEINLDNEDPKISKISGKIHIDGNSGWAAFKADGNCTGEGSYSQPYVIEDLEIDGGGSGSCISIENSDVYFKIENCTLYNSGGLWGDRGIRLNNVDNGQLIDNNCSANYRGIDLLNSCNNNNLSGNTANNNEYGIFLSNCEYNEILGNNASFNNHSGIYLVYSRYNTLSGNTISSNKRFGIRINDCGDNNIIDNIIESNGITGISINDGFINTVSENTVVNNNGSGIFLYEDIRSYISGNNVSNNLENGIYVTSNCNPTISGNIFSNNQENGIYTESSVDISNNTVNHNYNGIYIWNCGRWKSFGKHRKLQPRIRDLFI